MTNEQIDAQQHKQGSAELEIASLQQQLASARLERDDAQAQFDRHVEWEEGLIAAAHIQGRAQVLAQVKAMLERESAHTSGWHNFDVVIGMLDALQPDPSLAASYNCPICGWNEPHREHAGEMISRLRMQHSEALGVAQDAGRELRLIVDFTRAVLSNAAVAEAESVIARCKRLTAQFQPDPSLACLTVEVREQALRCAYHAKEFPLSSSMAEARRLLQLPEVPR